MTYLPRYDPLTGGFVGVTRADGAQIPADPANTDFQAFLAWNAQQAVPVSTAADPAAQLSAARAAKLAALQAWYADVVGQGVAAGGYTLAAKDADQANFTALVTLYQVALSSGAATMSTSVAIVDQFGSQQTMPLSTLFAVLLQYGQAVQAVKMRVYGFQAQIAAAADRAGLDAIAFS